MPTFHAYETAAGLDRVRLACNDQPVVEGWRERKRERKGNKAEDEDAEASGTRGTQRHANPRHPTQFLSLMIPVADCCFIGENHKLEKVSTKVPSLNFFNILPRFVIIRLFFFYFHF